MKIVTWNCNGALRNKIKKLVSIDADIYVVQECEYTDESLKIYKEIIPNHIWKGNNKNKGLAVFAKDNFKIEKLDWFDEKLELFLPVKIHSIQFLCVWTKYANSPTFQYIGQLWKYLQFHKEKMKDKPTIICGDLNSNSRWDVWDRWWNHTDVVNELDQLDISSAYHKIMKESQGQESQATFFMNRNLAKPYHIDYLFASNSIYNNKFSKVTILSKEEWLEMSDHLPMVFELSY